MGDCNIISVAQVVTHTYFPHTPPTTLGKKKRELNCIAVHLKGCSGVMLPVFACACMRVFLTEERGSSLSGWPDCSSPSSYTLYTV